MCCTFHTHILISSIKDILVFDIILLELLRYHVRELLYAKIANVEFNVMSYEEKLVYLINNCWKELSIYIEKTWDKRNQEFIYK